VRLEVRLYATLAEFVEGANAAEPFVVEASEDATVSNLLRQLHIPLGAVHLVIVDGRPIHDRTARLHDGDRVGLFPPVGGG